MPSPNATQPSRRPHSPRFSCGPCTKYPGWSLDVLKSAPLGRSHRAPLGKSRLQQVIRETHALLGLPADYRVGIVPGSDTGAVEAALWSLLGPRPVDVFAWESFGKEWVTDCLQQLTPLHTRAFVADFGTLPDLHKADFNHDVVFTWNGTTAGVIVPDGNWIPSDRAGLTICDATSSACAIPMPWDKLDVVTFSWQKVLGGEAQHGILILSPRAVDRLESHVPAWPVPKLFRLAKDGKLITGIFEGETINTPSMLCVEDALAAMAWARSVGGSAGLERRTRANAQALGNWVERTPWIDYLATDPATRSPTSVCLRMASALAAGLSVAEQSQWFKKIIGTLEDEGVAYDIGAYRDAPPGLRIWCGATVETEDIVVLTEWLDWAHAVHGAGLGEPPAAGRPRLAAAL
jgi:phosphoserine aminotransferase